MIIVNDVDNCSVSNILKLICKIRKKISYSWSESQQNSVIILQSDFIIDRKDENICCIINSIDCDKMCLHSLKI